MMHLHIPTVSGCQLTSGLARQKVDHVSGIPAREGGER